ncbi:recombinase family protein, partial [Lactococcus reticulitermitis]|uniref:recombinase family protein n=1 Tax=Pseudolactococcus reticulitermitis TaxID=2025039 RepID=UPI001054993F
MKTIQKIDSIHPQIRRRKRVAAYARVSKETDRLNHSLSAQVSYYSTLIQNHPEWQYAGVYTDFGISGTTMDKRDSLKNLLADCEQGKIDIILTKSISRFARNTVDLLKTVRHLKEINVEVRFEKENIHSLSGDGELMLSILASFAQEESRSISENIKWSLRKKREKGTGGIRYGRVFGYAYDGYNYQIVPTEAKIVKEIYRQYLSGLAMNKIVEQLNAKALTTVAENSFSICQIKAILTNELYIGDRKLQKFYVFDPISKHKRRNHGELDQYYMTDCHDPIIKRELFEKVQIEL